jgi:hypothetical protein
LAKMRIKRTCGAELMPLAFAHTLTIMTSGLAGEGFRVQGLG